MTTSPVPTLQCTVRSDVGKVRGHNEDTTLLRPDLGLVLIADGLGGYNAGEVASQRLADFVEATMAPFIQEPPDYATLGELLVETIAVANRNIYREAEGSPELKGMATTVVAALFQDQRLLVAHVGDSRLYRLRHEHLTQLTVDHTVFQSMLEQALISPETAENLHQSGVLTRAIGVEPEVEVGYLEFDVEPGDCYLLCSDGLTDMLADREIADALLAAGTDVDSAASRLIELANEWGGRDNVSVILARCPQAPKPLANSPLHRID